MQLGVIGLGRMGPNMVRRLLKGGHQCVVFYRSCDLGTRLHLSFALPPVSKTLVEATSWSRSDAFRIPPESDFRRPASN
jgi:6-phosphogluconate dehydrogenase (decarboxylating)